MLLMKHEMVQEQSPLYPAHIAQSDFFFFPKLKIDLETKS